MKQIINRIKQVEISPEAQKAVGLAVTVGAPMVIARLPFPMRIGAWIFTAITTRVFKRWAKKASKNVN